MKTHNKQKNQISENLFNRVKGFMTKDVNYHVQKIKDMIEKNPDNGFNVQYSFFADKYYDLCGTFSRPKECKPGTYDKLREEVKKIKVQLESEGYYVELDHYFALEFRHVMKEEDYKKVSDSWEKQEKANRDYWEKQAKANQDQKKMDVSNQDDEDDDRYQDDEDDDDRYQDEPTSYDKMSQREIQNLIDQALDEGDYEKVRQLSTFLKEGKFIYLRKLEKINERKKYNKNHEDWELNENNGSKRKSISSQNSRVKKFENLKSFSDFCRIK